MQSTNLTTFRSLLAGVMLGGLSGLIIRFWAQLPWQHNSTAVLVMTWSFLTLGPFAVGYVTVAASETAVGRSIWEWLILPWPAMVLSTAITWAINLEGLICAVFALPITLIFASVGGLVGGLVSRKFLRARLPGAAGVVLLPLIFSPIESSFVKPQIEHRIVQSEIEIHAPASIVWNNIERVRPIAPSELRPTWTHKIGFPRPVEATLSYEGVGGVRHASFEHGLLFIETVTKWDPNREIVFSIKADTKDIPPTTLDSHVTIGGRYFEVLQGAYRIEPLHNGGVMLHLASEERVSTDFNGYAGFWSDAVMKNLQNSILKVIKARCERDSAAQAKM